MAADRPVRDRRRRRGLVLLLLIVLGAGAGVAASFLLGDEDPYASPTTVELPPAPDDVGPTQGFLAGPEGVLARQAFDATRPLIGQPDVRTCGDVTRALQALGGPTAVFSAAAGIPDRATSEMALRHLDAATRFLGSCFEDDKVPDGDEITFTATILSRRLEELQ